MRIRAKIRPTLGTLDSLPLLKECSRFMNYVSSSWQQAMNLKRNYKEVKSAHGFNRFYSTMIDRFAKNRSIIVESFTAPAQNK